MNFSILEVVKRTKARLFEADTTRKNRFREVLMGLAHKLHEVAFLCEGDIERLTEQEAIDLDGSILENR